jgi:hypothetical protein
VLANYGFATVFAAPKLAGLQYLGRIKAEEQCDGSSKNGHSEAIYLAIVGYQSWPMLRQNCCALRPCSEKVVAVGRSNSN